MSPSAAVRAIPTAPQVGVTIPVPYRIVASRRETHDVLTLTVVPVDRRLPTFQPAQFCMIGVVGIGDVPISISSPVDQTAGHDYTIRASGAVTQALHGLSLGDVVSIRGPFGRAWDLDVADGTDIVVVAGGIGLAPLRAAVDVLAGNIDRARVTLLIGAVTPANLIFRSWLDGLADRGVTVVQTVDRLESDDTTWSGQVGLVTALIPDALRHSRDTMALICGPDPMMRATAATLTANGVPAEQIQLTLERNMHCGFGRCGHCQLGRLLICRDGPVVRLDELGPALDIKEL